jgi:hypothetical protein
MMSDPVAIFVDSSKNIFVANSTGNSVTEYSPGQKGNVAPFAIISGLNTNLAFPSGVALDAVANIYVTNGTPINSVTVYAPGSSGNVSPIGTISGPHTGLNGPDGILVDAKGDIFVSNAQGSSLEEFAPGSTGDAAPSAVISGGSTELNFPAGLAFDDAGNIYVANAGGNSVLEFAAGTNGNKPPGSMIAGPTTGLSQPTGVAVDGAGTIYVADVHANSITVYARGANGNTPPVMTIAGPATQLFSPGDVALVSNLPNVTPKPTPTPTATPRPSIFSISPTSISFPTIAAGATPATSSFTITNPGNDAKGYVDASALTRTKAFSVKGKGSFALAHGKTKTVRVQLLSSFPGTFAGTINVITRKPESEGVVVVVGTVQSGAVKVSQKTLDFHEVPVGTRQQQEFSVENTGIGRLRGNIRVSNVGKGFSVTTGLGSFRLSSKAKLRVVVQFAPTVKGHSFGSVKVNSDDPTTPTVPVLFGGTGV